MLTSKIKTELENLGIKPKKSLGQNFLVNEAVYRKIIAAAEIQKGNRVVEIGPGLGTLTQYLLNTGAEVIAVEKDHELADHLKTKFANQKNVKIIEEDILKLVPRVLGTGYSEKSMIETGRWTLDAGRFKVVGNIPYYLTSHLLRTIFEKWPAPEQIVLMIQKEVAQRVVGKPPKMSLLAILVQYYAHPKILSYVSKNNFWPAPEVDSAIIKLLPRVQSTGYSEKSVIETGRWTLDAGRFFKIVRAGFAGKRKQLGNNLAKGLKLHKNIVEEKLRSAGVDPMRRAETLTLDEWQKITNIFSLQD